ncbi:cation/H(+) antiporter [Sphingobacteriaceae bacterium]|nr:cation/H(+) antiporter [Sphingobacteriaceae bacterium]
MKNFKNTLFYIVIIGGFSAIMYFILIQGKGQEAGRFFQETKASGSNVWETLVTTYHYNVTHPLAILLLQIITIILVARFFGFICKKIKQPTVIGEIVAGIFLGPSFIGSYFPEFSGFLFPKQSLSNLQFLSQIGLILFMFIVGMELDLKMLKNKAKDAVIISHASIIFPFTLGLGLAYYIYQIFAPPTINFLSFALFTGIAMSITAFPVLARIVQEKGLTKTKLGTIVITCAAADDITAWCILAAVIAIVKAGSVISSLYTIAMALAYVFIMLKLVRPFLKNVGDKYSNKEGLSKPVVAVFFITLLLSSYITEVIGIHALFGAFMAGVIMPATTSFRNIFIEKVEDVSLVLLLPLFFVFTGLRTQIGLLNEPYLWQICGLIILVAVTGKFVGSALAAKFVGQSWKESLMIGALMNTRGLMELIVLNIGYDLGVLNPQVFAMMVIMALVTTLMTAPALELINWFFKEKVATTINEGIRTSKYNILVSFGSPQKGVSLLKLANSLVRKSIETSNITTMHLTPSTEINQFNFQEYEKESFRPVKLEAKKLNQPIHVFFKPSPDIEGEIIQTTNAGNYDLLLIGIGKSVFEGSLLGEIAGFTSKIINPTRFIETVTGKEKLFESALFDEKIKYIIKSSKVPVGILIDKKLDKVERVYVPIYSISDSFLLVYVQKLIVNSQAQVSILDVVGVIRQTPELYETIRSIEQKAPNQIALQDDKIVDEEFLNEQDLMLISLDSWKRGIEEESLRISEKSSVLILKP